MVGIIMGMNMNFIELFEKRDNQESPEGKELYSTLRKTALKLEKYLEGSDDEFKFLYTLSGDMYLPDISPNFCSIYITNINENRKEEIFCSKNAKLIGYIIGKEDGSTRAMKYNFKQHSSIVAENFYRILNELNDYLDNGFDVVVESSE
jgi:hypothetical protein